MIASTSLEEKVTDEAKSTDKHVDDIYSEIKEHRRESNEQISGCAPTSPTLTGSVNTLVTLTQERHKMDR